MNAWEKKQLKSTVSFFSDILIFFLSSRANFWNCQVELIFEIERMPFCQWNPVNNGPRVSHPTWNNRTVAHVITSNESDEQIGEARWSVSAISPIETRNGIAMQCRSCAACLVLAENHDESAMSSHTRNFFTIPRSLSFNHRWIFQSTREKCYCNVDHSIFRHLLVSLSFDRLSTGFFKIHSRYVCLDWAPLISQNLHRDK